ncbi:MAG TPA: PilZ domain-containing protein [Planctomycetota bacterium]|nr:PilZ domain-containing protein [Planctomycetota bacterium]
MPQADRRRSVRYAVKNCTALFRRRRMLFLFEGDPPHRGPVVDLSSQGISFITKRTLRPGDVILISFDIPFEVYAVPRGFRLKARVKWIGAAAGMEGLKRVGCAFNPLRRDEHELITRIIRYGILRER